MNDPNTQTLFALNFALLVQLIGVAQAVLIDPYITKDNRKRVYWIIAIVIFLLVEPQITNNYGDVLYKDKIAFWLTLLTAVSYILRSVTLYLFIRLTGNNWGLKILYAILGVNALVCISAFWKPWAYAFSPTGGWIRGPLGIVPFITCAILILWLVISAFFRYQGLRRRESLAPTIIAIMVAVSVYFDLMCNFSASVTYLTVAMTESTVFFYIWLHLQFVREHENALKAEQRIKIMMSQIQPHFLFNALSTIQALTETDPERASKVIEEFAVYLRQNINSLNQESMIPVRKEIEHTTAYSDIEQVRFPSIRIDYEIEDDDFLIPPLTIQPMVENAIRHGVRGKKHGWVSVSTYLEDDHHVISIRDNGKGFDVDSMIEATKNGDHIGIKNVRDRIEDMTGGTFYINSVIGEGTSIIMKIPRKRNNMNAICVDDEELILARTASLVKKTNMFDHVEAFSDPREALDYLDNESVKLALLDIDMPDMGGLELASELKKKSPGIKVIFLTGYSEYAVDAYAMHATGYLLKPVSYEKLLSELEYAMEPAGEEAVVAKDTGIGKKVKVQTFGYFNILVDGKLVVFKRNKAKELIACLVDRQGQFVSRKDMFYILWEDDDYDRAKQKYLDTIIRSLRDTLEEYDIADIFELESGMMRIVPEKLDCDLYRFLDEDEEAIRSFRGEYMSSYSWASATEGYLTERE